VKPYYWQRNPLNGQEFIAESRHEGFEQLEDVYAHCWLEARKFFGFELTPVQQSLLDNYLDSL
jgi:hypothetical protein